MRKTTPQINSMQSKQSSWARASFHLDGPQIRTGQAAHPPSNIGIHLGAAQYAHIRTNEKGTLGTGTRGADKAHGPQPSLQRGEEVR